MKISEIGMAKIKDRSQKILVKLNNYASMSKLSSDQREDFRDLQKELESAQRALIAFSKPSEE